MNKQQKQARVDSLREELALAQGLVVAGYQGLTVAEAQTLREEARKAGASIRVVKNTLARLSIQGTPLAVVSDHLVGPSLFAFGEDPVAPAKAIVKLAKEKNAKITVKVGVLNGKLLTDADVVALSKLPGIDEMRSIFLGTLNQVPQKFVMQLAAPARSMVTVLAARKDKLEESV